MEWIVEMIVLVLFSKSRFEEGVVEKVRVIVFFFFEPVDVYEVVGSFPYVFQELFLGIHNYLNSMRISSSSLIRSGLCTSSDLIFSYE